MSASTAFQVVLLEADLRRGEEYLAKTGPYVRQGRPAPAEFDEDVQRQALRMSGFQVDEKLVAQYREIVRKLPDSKRRQVFFLAANDQFFHPAVAVVGLGLPSGLVGLDGTTVELGVAARGCRGMFLLASTSS